MKHVEPHRLLTLQWRNCQFQAWCTVRGPTPHQGCGHVAGGGLSSLLWAGIKITSALRTRVGYPFCLFMFFFCCVILASVVFACFEVSSPRRPDRASIIPFDGPLGGSHSCIEQDGHSLAAREKWLDTVLHDHGPQDYLIFVVSVGLLRFQAGYLGQPHLREYLWPCLSSNWYCVLAGTLGLAVTTATTTICGIWHACLISTPRRRRWKIRKGIWEGHDTTRGFVCGGT